ncbi:MAG: DUF6452 family protein [Winogradskyella sp.]
MKHLKYLVLFITMACLSCERDDICAESTSTTPRLIVEFYDATDTDLLKNVPRLTVYGEDLPIPNPPTEETEATIRFNENTNSVALPLKIDAENIEVTTRFILERSTNLRLDTNASTTSNVDIIEIKYIPQFEYISRACGYKSIFTNLIVQEDIDGDSDRWITSIEVVDLIVENENTVHVRILH